MSITRERYFTERLFWLPDTNELLHVYFVHGHGWVGISESVGEVYLAPTYTELMQFYTHRNPELLLQEET